MMRHLLIGGLATLLASGAALAEPRMVLVEKLTNTS